MGQILLFGQSRQSMPWLLCKQLVCVSVLSCCLRPVPRQPCPQVGPGPSGSLETDRERLRCYPVETGAVRREEPDRPGY